MFLKIFKLHINYNTSFFDRLLVFFAYYYSSYISNEWFICIQMT